MNKRLQSTGLAALSFSVSAGILALALTPAVASASPSTGTDVEFAVTGERAVATKRVSIADLDLTDTADLKRLNARIRGAIGQVCDEPGSGRNSIAEMRCRYETRQATDLQVAALRTEAVALAAAGEANGASTIAVVAAR